MLIIKENGVLHQFITLERLQGKRIGFVPTMGALHDGHLELIKAAQKTCEFVVCSIFVNPTQFNDPADLARYPRPLERDIALLSSQGCDMLFIPAESMIYPTGLKTKLDLDPGPLARHMEGSSRPGHFDGVMQVVHRLLDLVQPDMLFMGQKDYQQVAVIRFMLEKTNSTVSLVMCPTFREKDGLAFSSRNVRLTPEWRKKSPAIYQALCMVKEELEKVPMRKLEERARDFLEKEGFKVDYFSIVDGYTLGQANKIEDHSLLVACTAVWAGDVRLIDNLLLKSDSPSGPY